MIIITFYHKDGLWKVKRSDRERSTFSDSSFSIAIIVAIQRCIELNGRLVCHAIDGVSFGQLDIFRAFIGGSELQIDDPDQIKIDLEVADEKDTV